MRIAPGFMLSIIITILGLQNLALWRFLGVFPGWLYVIGILLAGFVSWSMTRMQLSQNHADIEASKGPAWRRMFLLALVALAIFVLGGEGRFFSASPDRKSPRLNSRH